MADNETRLLSMDIQKGKRRTHTKQLDFSHINEDYVGTFKFHHPSLFEQMNIGVAKAGLLQGMNGQVDVLVENIAFMTATLQQVLDESPEWFKIDEIAEYEILESVYDEYDEWYNSFRTKSEEKNDKRNSKRPAK